MFSLLISQKVNITKLLALFLFTLLQSWQQITVFANLIFETAVLNMPIVFHSFLSALDAQKNKGYTIK